MGDDISFDRAEFSAPPQQVTCQGCGQPVTGSYYEVNGRIVCDACQERVRTQLTFQGGPEPFIKAAALGALAAAVGAAVWIGFSRVTGYQIGWIAIGVGWLVGKAVQRGAGGRGGPAYQALAVGLSYAAMVSSYAPALFRQGLPTETADWVRRLGVMFAAPFLMGFENVIGLFIIGLGLYEAWKHNRRHQLVVTGPYQIGSVPNQK